LIERLQASRTLPTHRVFNSHKKEQKSLRDGIARHGKGIAALVINGLRKELAMKRLTLISSALLVGVVLAPSSEAADRPPLFEFRGTFGTASFVGAERHEVAGFGFRWNATERFSIEPELLFMRAPLPCYYACGDYGGTDRDVVFATNFIYRLTDSTKRVQPYFTSGIGYLKHQEETTLWTDEHQMLWMHFGLGLRVRVTDRVSLLPEVRVGVDGAYATLSAAYGFIPERNPTRGGRRSQDNPQKVARSFEELRELLEPGTGVTVTDAKGNEIRGKVETIASAEEVLTLRSSGKVDGNAGKNGLLTLSRDDVYRIDARTRDPLTNGIAIGAAVGAGLGALAAAGCECEGAGYAALYMTGLGASLGMAIDALLSSKKIVFLASESTPGVRLRVVPLVSKDKKGVTVVVDF
jgi:hypothetical protein